MEARDGRDGALTGVIIVEFAFVADTTKRKIKRRRRSFSCWRNQTNLGTLTVVPLTTKVAEPPPSRLIALYTPISVENTRTQTTARQTNRMSRKIRRANTNQDIGKLGKGSAHLAGLAIENHHHKFSVSCVSEEQANISRTTKGRRWNRSTNPIAVLADLVLTNA
jgi:hypothetical protein